MTYEEYWASVAKDPAELERVTQELAKCESDFDYFAETYVHILDAQKQMKVKWSHWPCHKLVVESILNNKFTIILKARQLGISWICVIYALWLCLFKYGSTVAVFSQREEDASDLLHRAGFIYKHLPMFLQAKVRKQNETEFSFEEQDSQIRAYPAKGNAGRSQSATMVICDEWAHHPEAEEQWAAMLPIINEGNARFVGISTANGAGNFYHSTWQGATQGSNDFVPIFFSWRERPDRDDAWYERTKANMRPEIFKQEFPGTPEEAFRQTGTPAFDADFLGVTAPHSQPVKFTELPLPLRLDSAIEVFLLPQPGRKYCMGVDVAEGEARLDGKGDATDITLIDWEANWEVLHLSGRWPVNRQAEIVDAIARFYDPCVVGIERNGIGVAVIKKCEELGTPGLFREVKVLRKLGEPETPGKHGWVTSKANKDVLIQTLEEHLRMGYHRVASKFFTAQALVYQNFGGGKYGAPSGFHDDAVMSRAIALQMRNHINQAPTVGPRVIRRGRIFNVA
jgi:hypothetical protein